jgi:ribosomal protein L5
MNLLNYHINRIVLQDFLLKYQIKNTKFIPKIKKISLSARFGPNHKASIISLFEILSFHKPYITQSRMNILALNLRKGEAVGIKLVLRKKSIYDFLIYFLFEVLPSLKKFDVLKINSKSLHWQIKDLFALDETTYLYIYLIELRSLDIVIEGNYLKPNFFIASRFPIRKISSMIKKI